MAGPAPPGLVAGAGPARAGRSGGAAVGGGVAGRGETAVLCRDHAGAGAVDRDRRAGAGGGRGSAVAIAGRAGHSFEAGGRAATAAVVAARSGRRSALCAGRSGVVARVEAVAADRLAQLADAVDDREYPLVPTADPAALVGCAGADQVGAPDRGPGPAGAVVGECADDDRGLPAALVPAASRGWRDTQYVGHRVRHGPAHAGGCGRHRDAAAGCGRAERLARQGVDAARVRVDLDLRPRAGRGRAGAAPVRRLAQGPAGSHAARHRGGVRRTAAGHGQARRSGSRAGWTGSSRTATARSGWST